VQLVSKTSNLCDHVTDKQTTCDCNTALCIIVHRAVKISRTYWLIKTFVSLVKTRSL